MASLKEEIAAKLAAVAAPDGRPLTATGKLSDIVATDGKVFLSITVDAAEVKTSGTCAQERRKCGARRSRRPIGHDRAYR